MSSDKSERSNYSRTPWNKGRRVGQKRPLRPKDVWAIRVRLEVDGRTRDLAMFNLAIDSKLRGCDLVGLRVEDVTVAGRVRDRATIIQRKTGRPDQFEITEPTRASVHAWLAVRPSDQGAAVFPSRGSAPVRLYAAKWRRVVKTRRYRFIWRCGNHWPARPSITPGRRRD